MNIKYVVLLPALMLVTAGCVQEKQVDYSKNFQQLADSINKLNVQVEEIGERVDVIEQQKDSTEVDLKFSEGKKNLALDQLPVTIYFPDEYTVQQFVNEPSRRGSYMAYEFLPKTGQAPYLGEIQLFTRESIKACNERTEEQGPCFFGDYPTVERFDGQRITFESGGRNYGELDSLRREKTFLGQRFNDVLFLVTNHNCVGDSCVIREYTTFVDDVKIDFWIIMDDEAQSDESDKLFKEVIFDIPPEYVY